jgi:hypothetical protein
MLPHLTPHLEALFLSDTPLRFTYIPMQSSIISTEKFLSFQIAIAGSGDNIY